MHCSVHQHCEHSVHVYRWHSLCMKDEDENTGDNWIVHLHLSTETQVICEEKVCDDSWGAFVSLSLSSSDVQLSTSVKLQVCIRFNQLSLSLSAGGEDSGKKILQKERERERMKRGSLWDTQVIDCSGGERKTHFLRERERERENAHKLWMWIACERGGGENTRPFLQLKWEEEAPEREE